jgi:hypothetical protein
VEDGFSPVSCWRAPVPPAVRTMATRSPGRIWPSMNASRARLTGSLAAGERCRSSNINTNVKWPSSGAIPPGKGPGHGWTLKDAPSVGVSACLGTNEKSAIFCGLPFCRTSNSDSVRPEAACPALSVTVTSICTRSAADELLEVVCEGREGVRARATATTRPIRISARTVLNPLSYRCGLEAPTGRDTSRPFTGAVRKGFAATC